MELSDLVRQALGDEEVTAGVSLGDEDAVCFTPTRSLVYRGEGLLSDEDVSEYPHDFERLAVSEGRRKTKFTMTYVDRKAEFAVPGKRADVVLERLLEGALRVDDVIGATEAVEGVFRFSELTLIVAQHRLIKHVGEYTWDGDFEVYPFDDVTALRFEDGSVATAVVLEADGRPERIKAPNEEAPLVRQTLEEALFAHHDVGSLDQLNDLLSDDEAGGDGAEDATGAASGGFGLESGIDPLVSDDGNEGDTEATDRQPEPSPGSTADQSGGGAGEPTAVAASDATRPVDVSGADGDAASREEMEAVVRQLSELTDAVERQNELLTRQQQTVQQLIEELRQGR